MYLKNPVPYFLVFIGFASCQPATHGAPEAASVKDSIVFTPPAATPIKDSITYEMGERLKLSCDLNGDHIMDTIYESYISRKTGQETYKHIDGKNVDIEMERDTINANQPISRIFTRIPGVDTLVLTNNSDQYGIAMLENLGDLNEDGGDEIGYIIHLAGHSTLNEYTIITLTKEKKWKKILTFMINETGEEQDLFDGKSMIKKTGPYTFKYKYYDGADEELPFKEKEFVIDTTK